MSFPFALHQVLGQPPQIGHNLFEEFVLRVRAAFAPFMQQPRDVPDFIVGHEAPQKFENLATRLYPGL